MRAILYIILFLFISQSAFAELLQIIHTNDVHGHLRHSIHRTELGGYARLKTMIDEFRAFGEEHGIGTVVTDGGDFFEGNSYYLAENGKKNYRVLNMVGYDAVVLGNHDYLMGTRDLDNILRDVPVSFTLLGKANMYVHERYRNIGKHLKPYKEMVINGVKVGILGVNLNDPLYKWRLYDGKITSEYKAAKKYAKILKKRGNDLVILLSHAGKTKDKKMAKKIPEIDIVLGGHHHVAYHELVWQKNRKTKRMIPMVIAGKHLEWVAQLIIDFDKKTKKFKVVRYGLHEVVGPKSQDVEDMIDSADQDLSDQYGEDWLYQVVGHSKLKPAHLGGKGHKDVWQYFVNDAMREATNSDFSITVEALSGSDYPIGPVTRRMLYDGNPRTFEFEKKYGYNVATARVRGYWIKTVFRLVMAFGIPLYVSGVTFKWKKGPWGYWVYNLRHHGKRIKPFKLYKVSMCEAIVRGGYAISKLVNLLLKYGDETRVSQWQALEEKFEKIKVLDENYLDDYWNQPGDEKGLVPIERVYFPGKEE
jgi:5'-nucleotidase / UDP-sugar diphosphatase